MDPQSQRGAAGGSSPSRQRAGSALYHDPRSIARLAVTVHRATNLELGAVNWSLPWVVAGLGSSVSQSPESPVKDGLAEFDWSTELRYTGSETHLTLAVHTSQFAVIGVCFLPVEEVFRRPVLRKALPLLRNGQTRRGFGPDDRLSEISITVACVRADSGLSARMLRHRAAQDLWSHCAQVRVIVRSLRLEPVCLSDKLASHRPYVRASLGVQEYRTMTARKVTRRQAEEFVFVHRRQRFPFDELFTSDTYEGPLVNPAKGSAAVPAYRKTTNGEVHVTYRDVWFVFWLAQQSLLQLDVADDYIFSRDRPLAAGSLDFVDLFQRIVQGEGDAQSGLMHLGPFEVPLHDTSHHTRDHVNKPAGGLQIEVDFMREPLAVPSQLEGVFRDLNSIVRQRTEQRTEAVRGVQEMLAGVQVGDGAVGSISSLPERVRCALAAVLTTTAISDTRGSLRHEVDSAAALDSLTNAVQLFMSVLSVPELQAAEVVLATRSMTTTGTSQEQAISTYRSCCEEHSLSELLPFAELIDELLRRFGGYSAKVYTTILHAGASVVPNRSDSRMFVELVERHLVLAGQGRQVPMIPSPERACQTALALTQTAKDLTEGECVRSQQEEVPETSSGWWFLPSVDTKRLFESQQMHPGDRFPLLPEFESRIFYGTAATALLAALLGGASTVALASMLRHLEVDLFCDKTILFFPSLRKAVCHMATSSKFDAFVIDFISSNVGSASFALLYFMMYGYEAYTRLCTRYSAVKELALEPLGPPSSFHAVLCASGFLTSLGGVFQPWEAEEECPWTHGQVIAIRFETGILMRLGFGFMDTLAWATKSTYWLAMGVVYCSNPISMSCYVMDWLLSEFDDLFDVACFRADQAGQQLAQQLVQSYAGYGRPARPVSLVAFSTGAVLMYACLKELQRLASSGEAPVAANLVCDAVLLGAPLQGDNTAKWAELRALVSGRLVVGYLANDMTLMSYKHRRGFRTLTGVDGLFEVPGVENIPMSDFITKHVDYAKQMPAILAHIMRC